MRPRTRRSRASTIPWRASRPGVGPGPGEGDASASPRWGPNRSSSPAMRPAEPSARSGELGAGAVGAHLAVVAAAILFGTTFFVVKDAVARVQPVPFLAMRFLI